jgi:hypothetical protein
MREYFCRACQSRHAGWRILQASPPEFLLQPHHMYPMTRKSFEHWARVLRVQFADHPVVAGLIPLIGKTFVPNDHVLRTRLRNAFRNRRRYFGRLRRRVRQWIGTGS